MKFSDSTNFFLKKNNFALVLVSSADYSDLWEIFFYYWEKNLKNINIKKYIFSSDNKIKKFKKIKVIYPIYAKRSNTWSKRQIDCLKQIKEQNLIVINEDYIVNKKVNKSLLLSTLTYFINRKLKYLKLSRYFWEPSRKKKNLFIKPDKYEMHKMPLSIALWNKETLLNLLDKKENFNEFDRNSFKRFHQPSCLAKYCNFNLISYVEIVHRGKFNYHAKKIINNMKSNQILNRKFLDLRLEFIFFIKRLKYLLYFYTPAYLKKFIIKNKFIGKHLSI